MKTPESPKVAATVLNVSYRSHVPVPGCPLTSEARSPFGPLQGMESIRISELSLPLTRSTYVRNRLPRHPAGPRPPPGSH